MEKPDNVERLEMKPWQRALIKFKAEGKTYGSVLTDQWLYEAFEIPYPGPQVPYSEAQKSVLAALGARQRLFEELLERHQMLASPDGGGSYRIVEPKEQTEIAMAEGRQAIKREVDKIQSRLLNVNVAMLSDVERKQNADALARQSNLSSMVKSVWPRRSRGESSEAI